MVIAADVAEPEASVTEPREAEPSKNSTVPVAVPAPGAIAATVAVKVTDCPKTEGFTEDVNAVVVLEAKVNRVFAALVPPALVTITLAVPKVPAGVIAVMVVELTTITLVAVVPPMVTTFGPATKLVPVMVMVVPPVERPLVGEILVTVGAA